MTDERLTISELSERSGLSKHTLRYYERIGLLPLVDREQSSGHRRYRPEHAHWVAFIRDLRSTGMPIREVQAYAKLAVHREASWPQRREMLAAHRERVLERMADLERHLRILDRKLERGCDPERSKTNDRATPAKRQPKPRSLYADLATTT